MKKAQHDLLILGAGPGGYVAAIRAAQLGLDTAVVEKEPALGGTCLRVGCIPSKALLEASHRYAEAKAGLGRFGVELEGVGLDLAAMMRHKETTVTALTKGVAGLFKKNRVRRYRGTGRLAGPGTVEVEGEEAARIEAEHILIATGSSVATLPGVELDGEHVTGSTQALSYPEVPGRLVVVGAGYIGLELGSVWRRLGAEVVVLELLDRILPGMDGELAKEAQRLFTKQGLELRLGVRVRGAKVDRRKKRPCVVEVEGAEAVEGDRVLVAVGRRPYTAGLGLEEVGIELDDKGRIPVDGRFRTTAEGVYAIGDVIAGPMLAHKAEEEGIACVEGIVRGSGHVSYDAIPAIVYTHPEIAAVGKTEEQLADEGIDYRKGKFPFQANGRARALGDTAGWVKILADAATDRILGAHLIGPRAGDLVAELAVAVEFGASAEDVARSVHAHPTLAEAVKEAALAVAGRAIHI